MKKTILAVAIAATSFGAMADEVTPQPVLGGKATAKVIEVVEDIKTAYVTNGDDTISFNGTNYDVTGDTDSGYTLTDGSSNVYTFDVTGGVVTVTNGKDGSSGQLDLKAAIASKGNDYAGSFKTWMAKGQLTPDQLDTLVRELKENGLSQRAKDFVVAQSATHDFNKKAIIQARANRIEEGTASKLVNNGRLAQGVDAERVAEALNKHENTGVTYSIHTAANGAKTLKKDGNAVTEADIEAAKAKIKAEAESRIPATTPPSTAPVEMPMPVHNGGEVLQAYTSAQQATLAELGDEVMFLHNEVDRLDTRIDQTQALNAATVNARPMVESGKTAFGAGVGYSNSESALAIGVAHNFEDTGWSASGTVAITSDDTVAGAGVQFAF